jgi:hypothetical protein
MSRGLGRIQRAVLDIVTASDKPIAAADVAWNISGDADYKEPSRSLVESVRRAAHGLAKQGLIQADSSKGGWPNGPHPILMLSQPDPNRPPGKRRCGADYERAIMAVLESNTADRAEDGWVSYSEVNRLVARRFSRRATGEQDYSISRAARKLLERGDVAVQFDNHRRIRAIRRKWVAHLKTSTNQCGAYLPCIMWGQTRANPKLRKFAQFLRVTYAKKNNYGFLTSRGFNLSAYCMQAPLLPPYSKFWMILFLPIAFIVQDIPKVCGM